MDYAPRPCAQMAADLADYLVLGYGLYKYSPTSKEEENWYDQKVQQRNGFKYCAWMSMRVALMWTTVMSNVGLVVVLSTTDKFTNLQKRVFPIK